jgi:hypothetical protein
MSLLKNIFTLKKLLNPSINNFMKLFEMFNPPVPGYQDVNKDNSKPTWRTSRKTKLTLKQLRKLRKMLDVRNYEKKEYLKKVKEQYSQASTAQPSA